MKLSSKNDQLELSVLCHWVHCVSVDGSPVLQCASPEGFCGDFCMVLLLR